MPKTPDRPAALLDDVRGGARLVIDGVSGKKAGGGRGAAGAAASAKALGDAWLGDGLVPLASALGRHASSTRDLHIPPSHIWIGRGINHLALLSSEAVDQRLRRWLAA